MGAGRMIHREMPLAGSSSTNAIAESATSYAAPNSASSSSVRGHSAAITVEPQPRSSSCTSEEGSEESVPDSWEEGRAPLLRRPQSIMDDLERGELDNPTANDGDETPSGDATDGIADESSKTTRRRLPQERRKAGVAFLMLFLAGALNDLVLSYIHEYVPDIEPLPDFAFRFIPYWSWALVVSECLMISSFAVMLTITVAHKYRWIVLRRIFTIGTLLYLGRCVTMFVTQVPKADANYYCSPKLPPEQRTFWHILVRGLSVLVGLGLSINGRHTLCGDYIYSGHTVVHVTCYLFIREYSPRRWRVLHWASACVSFVGVLSLLFSRGHYSVDVVVAYWITTRVFWIYHTLADLPALRNDLQGRNHLTKTIWYPLFVWMEGRVHRPVPKRYELPFTVPGRLRRWWARRRRGSSIVVDASDRDRLMAE